MITRMVFQWAFVLSWAAQLTALGASANNAANGTVITNAALQSAVEKYAFLSPYNPLHPQEIAPPFRIQPYLAVAAALQAMPRDQALAQLRAWAAAPNRQFSNQVRNLCGLLFTGKDGKNLRGPLIGEPSYMGVPLQPIGRIRHLRLLDQFLS